MLTHTHPHKHRAHVHLPLSNLCSHTHIHTNTAHTYIHIHTHDHYVSREAALTHQDQGLKQSSRHTAAGNTLKRRRLWRTEDAALMELCGLGRGRPGIKLFGNILLLAARDTIFDHDVITLCLYFLDGSESIFRCPQYCTTGSHDGGQLL